MLFSKTLYICTSGIYHCTLWQKTVKFRKIKSINLYKLKADIKQVLDKSTDILMIKWFKSYLADRSQTLPYFVKRHYLTKGIIFFTGVLF